MVAVTGSDCIYISNISRIKDSQKNDQTVKKSWYFTFEIEQWFVYLFRNFVSFIFIYQKLNISADLETQLWTIILAFALQYVCVSVVCQLKANNGSIDRFETVHLGTFKLQKFNTQSSETGHLTKSSANNNGPECRRWPKKGKKPREGIGEGVVFKEGERGGCCTPPVGMARVAVVQLFQCSERNAVTSFITLVTLWSSIVWPSFLGEINSGRFDFCQWLPTGKKSWKMTVLWTERCLRICAGLIVHD